ncbi:hypothetical protein DFH09DRAFT_1273401 [Mycena vulgaris]|nr:hypothetical protein DFH09DRAFT_1273401 [Mycena vulgaris]
MPRPLALDDLQAPSWTAAVSPVMTPLRRSAPQVGADGSSKLGCHPTIVPNRTYAMLVTCEALQDLGGYSTTRHMEQLDARIATRKLLRVVRHGREVGEWEWPAIAFQKGIRSLVVATKTGNSYLV